MLIFILGYMGSGKTTLGKQLAGELSYRFLDLDTAIEAITATSVSEYFRRNGEMEFRKVERDILRSFLEDENTVIATGGGTPCFFDNMKRMNEAGLTVYLHLTADELYDRLKDEYSMRPLLNGHTGKSLKAVIARHLEEREPFYLSSKVICNPATHSLTDLLRPIL